MMLYWSEYAHKSECTKTVYYILAHFPHASFTSKHFGLIHNMASKGAVTYAHTDLKHKLSSEWPTKHEHVKHPKRSYSCILVQLY